MSEYKGGKGKIITIIIIIIKLTGKDFILE